MASNPTGEGFSPPEAGRWWVGASVTVILLLLGVVFGEAARRAQRTVAGGPDQAILAWVVAHRTDWPGLSRAFRAITRLGDRELATPVVLAIAVGIWVLARRGVPGLTRFDVLFWLGVNTGGWLLSNLFKAWFQHGRPPPDGHLVAVEGHSFPSTHAVFAAVVFGMLAALIVRTGRPRSLWLRGLGLALCGLGAGMLAASRVWLGVHYPSDVLGGLVLGAAWVLACWLIRLRWERWGRGRALRAA